MSYPGSKGGSGVWQKIISHMPVHVHYIEAFAGSAVILKTKRPAPGRNIGIDVDRCVCDRLSSELPVSAATVICGDAMQWLPDLQECQEPTTLVYCDPPYLAETRTRRLYAHELYTPDEHESLLTMLQGLRCMVMLSGYWSQLYHDRLSDWGMIHFPAMTRGGLREEHLWMNFPAGRPLHDTRWHGEDYRERERIKRKRKRWTLRLMAMPQAERQILREAITAIPDDAAGVQDPAPSLPTMLEAQSFHPAAAEQAAAGLYSSGAAYLIATEAASPRVSPLVLV